MERKKDRTVVDASTQTMRCEECGDEIPIPLGAMDWVIDVSHAFAMAHRRCKGRKGTTGFSVPKSK